MSGSETVSPTAHYTGYVWARNGLSHRALETREARILYESLRPVMTVSELLGEGTLESYLLARHRAVRRIWARFAATLGGFAAGVYISDIHVGAAQDAAVRAFRVLLSAFVRGRVYLHFDSPQQVVAALREAGFAAAEVRPAVEVADLAPRGRAMRLVHILEASSTRSGTGEARSQMFEAGDSR